MFHYHKAYKLKLKKKKWHSIFNLQRILRFYTSSSYNWLLKNRLYAYSTWAATVIIYWTT